MFRFEEKVDSDLVLLIRYIRYFFLKIYSCYGEFKNIGRYFNSLLDCLSKIIWFVKYYKRLIMSIFFLIFNLIILYKNL